MATLDASNYQNAEKLLRHSRPRLVRGGKVRPLWIEDGRRFLYTTDTAEGRKHIVVDPVARTREDVADPVPLMGKQNHNFLEVTSPDGTYAAFRRGHDIWVRSEEDGREWALTTNGEEDYEYGTGPDSFTPFTLLKKIGIPHLPPAVAWSPDSKRVLTHLTDQRGVRRTHLIESVPADGGEPTLLTQRYAFPGDTRLPLAELVVIDVASGDLVRADAEPLAMPLISPLSMRWAWWAEDGSAVCYLSQSRDMHTLRLHRFDPDTGEVTTLVEESGETRVEPAQQAIQLPIVKVFSDGHEVLWYSQRDGWGHLYLYVDGELHGQVTSGEWGVQEILHVDESARVAYFVASGLVAEDPYRRTVCRVGLDGSGFARITDDELDHIVQVSPNKDYFIDSASTTALPPVITLRTWDGSAVVELEKADISQLTATGWTAPERFCVKAADGVTDIYGLLYKPHGFDPARSYPVLDNPYPGPGITRVQPSFDPGMLGYDAEAVAALGFVVVAIDGRGTPGRSKAFHDLSYGHLAEAGGLADHVAALRQLAGTRPWMDLDRVGIFGYSGGGFATVRAMCDFPDFYKVGVAESGNHDQRYFHLGWGETYEGPIDDETYAHSSNVEVADKLEGELLLIHGGSDDNVSPHLTLQLVDRLIAADKDFDLLIIPGAEHAFVGYEHYLNRRKWDFLVRHLMGIEPPKYHLSAVPMDMEMIAEIFG